MARIGLVAGEGKLPMVFARVAKEKGDIVIDGGNSNYKDSIRRAALL